MTSWVSRHVRARSEHDEGGFTLVELLIVCVVTPLLVGSLAMGLMAAFQLQGGVSDRLMDTGDAQVVASTYQNDVQSATAITTQNSSTPQCGSGTQLLGLEWNLSKATTGPTAGVFQTVVSYNVVDNGGTPDTHSLVREECDNLVTNSGALVASSTTTLSYDMPASQQPPTVTCLLSNSTTPTTNCATSSGWITVNNPNTPAIGAPPVVQDIQSVKFDITEPRSKYEYTLLAVPAASAAQQPAGSPIASTTTTSCGFATPNTGTYASTLCFVDFAPLNNSQNMAVATSGVGCGLEMSVALPGNYTLYFCIAISGAPVSAVGFPTWPGAFLGNSINGVPFYIGVQGDPALYQCAAISTNCNVVDNGNTDTVSITNIVVNNPQGTPATGWAAVGADAETTDPGENMIFSSNVKLSLLNNTPTSPLGDACNEPSGYTESNPDENSADQSINNGVGTGLTGLGTTTVECQSTWQASGATPRTGTSMVWATTPSTFSFSMQGSGLQGLSFGMLLS